MQITYININYLQGYLMKRVTMPIQNLDLDLLRLLISDKRLAKNERESLKNVLMYIEETVFSAYRLSELDKESSRKVYDYLMDNDLPGKLSSAWFTKDGTPIQGIR